MKLITKLSLVLILLPLMFSCTTEDIFEDQTEISTKFYYVKNTDWSGSNNLKTAELTVPELTQDILDNAIITVYNHPQNDDGEDNSRWQPLSYTYPDFNKETNSILTKCDFKVGKIVLTLLSPLNQLGTLLEEAEYKVVIIKQKAPEAN